MYDVQLYYSTRYLVWCSIESIIYIVMEERDSVCPNREREREKERERYVSLVIIICKNVYWKIVLALDSNIILVHWMIRMHQVVILENVRCQMY